MTFQEFYSIRRDENHNDAGIILTDILLAFGLSALCVTVMSQTFLDASYAYNKASAKSNMLDDFDTGANLVSEVRPYGNERFETTEVVDGSLHFTKVDPISGFDSTNRSSEPLCSVNFAHHSVVGSYENDTAFASTPVATSSIIVTPVVLPINPSIPLTHLEVRNGLAYVSADSTVSSDPDLYLFDIRDPAHPSLLASINTGPGLASFALMKDRIYAVARSSAAQLHIIRRVAPNSLILEKKYQLPPPYATATEPLGSTVTGYGSRVYLGTEKWDGDEFNSIDISDPLHPSKRGGYEVGSKVNDVMIVPEGGGLHAVIADADLIQMHDLDLGDESHIYSVGGFSPSGSSRQEGQALSIFEGSVALARTSGGFDIPTDPELFIWGSSTAQAFGPNTPYNVPGGAYGVVMDRRGAFAATRYANKEFFVPPSFYLSLPSAPQSLTCDGNTIYVLAHNAPAIYEISFK